MIHFISNYFLRHTSLNVQTNNNNVVVVVVVKPLDHFYLELNLCVFPFDVNHYF